MSTATEHRFAEVWERTIQPGQASLTPDAARYFLQLRIDAKDQGGERPGWVLQEFGFEFAPSGGFSLPSRIP